MKYYISFKDEFGEWNDQDFESDDLCKATSEARDLQRILSKEKKESGAYYAVFERLPVKNKLVYKANGY